MKKEIKIQIPEGFEIDKENSTFEKIVFREVVSNLSKIYSFNNTTEEEFNKKWGGFEDHEKYGALEKLIVNYYNKGEKPNWKKGSQYKYYPYFVMDKDNFRCNSGNCWTTSSDASARHAYLRKDDMLEAVEIYLDVYKKSRL
jgi:hypothetical protein